MARNSVNLETTTHVAGPVIRVNERILQRCPVCGAKLADNEDPTLQAFWEEAELVREDASGFSEYGGNDFLNRKRLPSDFCIDLVET